MKKLFLGLSAIAMLFATSCQNEMDFGASAGETATVAFKVETPEIQTRSYSDGTTATVLQYAVYDAAGNELTDLTVTNGEIHGSTSVNLQLTTGNTYSVIFWAAAPNAPYSVDFATKQMTVDYTNAVSNDENRDAFYKHHTFTVKGAQTETIELRRPFAQLNIGTADYAASTSAGYTPEYSYVKVPVSSVLNLVDGTVNEAAAVEFKLAEIPTNEEFPVAGYDYLSMNYLLVAADKHLVDVTFGYSENNTTVEKSRVVGSVPVQRNHRTNLYGQLLTSDVTINVEIKPAYEDEMFNNEHLYISEEGTCYVKTVEGLRLLAQKINDGDPNWVNATIALDSDIDLAATRSAASNWTPMGNGDNVFEGVFDGKGYTIKNLNLVYTEPAYFIGFFGAVENATIKNVTFENVYVNVASDNTNEGGHIAAVAGYAKNTTFENVVVVGDVKVESTFENNASSRVAVVLGGNNGGTVTMNKVRVIANEGSYVKANNSVGALGGQLQGEATFENCSSNIDVIGYKFFAGGLVGNAPQSATFKNCSTTGDVTITNGRSGNANDLYRVGAIAGGWGDNLNTSLVLIDCSYTGTISGQDADGNIATDFVNGGFVGRGYFAVVGAKVYVNGIEYVYQGNGKETADGAPVVNSKAALEEAIANGESEIYLAAGEYTMPAGSKFSSDNVITCAPGTVFTGNSKLNINGATIVGATFSNPSGSAVDQTINGTFVGCTFEGSNALRWCYTGETAVFESCVFDGSVYGIHFDGGKDKELVFRNCVISGFNGLASEIGMVTFEGCTFVGSGKSGYNGANLWGSAKMIDCEFTFDGSTANEWIDCIGAGKTYEFTNCTINGEAYTPANYTQFGQIFSRNHVAVKIDGVDCAM